MTDSGDEGTIQNAGTGIKDSTGVSVTATEDFDFIMQTNALSFTGSGSTGINFERLQTPASILINNNAIELFSMVGSNEAGFDSVIVTGALTYGSISSVQLNNTVTLIDGSEGLLEEVFGLPAGNGFILINGIPQP